jgi:hypothetical protein
MIMNINEVSLGITAVSALATFVLGGWALRMNKQQGQIVTRLDRLQRALAEVQLREKITVVKQRAERFRLPLEGGRKHTVDEAVTLRGDCEAPLPLFGYARQSTRDEYIKAVTAAALALGSGNVERGEFYKAEICECLSEHIKVADAELAPEIADQLRQCSLQIESGEIRS